MRLKLTIFLALLNIIAFGAIYFFETGRNGSVEPSAPEPVLSSSITNSTRIEVTGKAIPERRVIVREGEHWKLEEPIQWRANPNAIDRIFRSLLFLRQDIRFTMEDIERNNQSLVDYGLETPALILSFFNGEEEQTIKIGSPTDVGGRFYLLGPSGNEVFVVDEEVVRAVALDLQDLRSRGLFAMDFFSVQEISLQTGNGRNLQTRLAATEEGWNFESPIQTRASAPAVDSRLQRILEVPVLALEPESDIPPSDSGIIEPRMRISLEDGGSRQTFILGNPTPTDPDNAYGKIEGLPTILTVPEEPFLAFKDAQTNLRERSFFLFRLPLVSSLSIRSGPRTISLQKLEDQSWQVSASGDDIENTRYAADPGVLARTFESLITLRALRFISDAPSDLDLEEYGLDTPQRTVSVVGEETDTLLLGNLEPDTKTIYAKTGEAPFVYAVPLQIIRDLPVSPLFYRLRILNQLPELARIQSVKINDLESGEVLLDRVLGEDGKSWTDGVLDDPEEAANTAFLEVLKQLRTFRVESYLSPEFTPGLQIEEERLLPWRYRLEAKVLLPGGGESAEETLDYVLTERIEGTLQGGGSSKEDVTFILPQDFIDAWSELFPERPLPDEYKEEAASEAVRQTAETADPLEEVIQDSSFAPENEDEVIMIAPPDVGAAPKPEAELEEDPVPNDEKTIESQPEA
ncbi:MAG: DUF4340 domain-containing protein [Verrucomicrobiota bacterium]